MFDDDFTEDEWAEHKAIHRAKRIQNTIDTYFSKQFPKIKAEITNPHCACGDCWDCIRASSWGEKWRLANVLPR